MADLIVKLLSTMLENSISTSASVHFSIETRIRIALIAILGSFYGVELWKPSSLKVANETMDHYRNVWHSSGAKSVRCDSCLRFTPTLEGHLGSRMAYPQTSKLVDQYPSSLTYSSLESGEHTRLRLVCVCILLLSHEPEFHQAAEQNRKEFSFRFCQISSIPSRVGGCLYHAKLCVRSLVRSNTKQRHLAHLNW